MPELTYNHSATMDALAAICRYVPLLPLEKARQVVGEGHAYVPILDPTAYQRGMTDLVDQAKLIDAALALQRVVIELTNKEAAGG